MNLDAVKAALLFGGRGAAQNFGAANAGKHLIVGQDGRVTAAYTGRSGSVQLTDLAALRQIAADGEAAQHFAAGDLIANRWTDTVSGQSYDNPLHINHFSVEALEDGTLVPGMWVQTQYAHPLDVQFSQYQAIMVCDDGLAAGTYSFTFGDTQGTRGFVAKGVSFNFTLTKPVPTGGRLAGLRNSWDKPSPFTTLKIYVYAEDRKTILETADIAEGKAGTDLGTVTHVGDEKLNSIHRFSFGDNSWERSALRQYLNSDKPKGAWWQPQSKWDLAPDQLSQVDGYLCGMDPALLAALRPVAVPTVRSKFCYDDKAQSSALYTTYDKVILPSTEQMYIDPQQPGEGEEQEYWRQLNGTSVRYQRRETYPELRTYALEDHTAAKSIYLRSATTSSGSRTLNLTESGNVSSSTATTGMRFAPMMFIG